MAEGVHTAGITYVVVALLTEHGAVGGGGTGWAAVLRGNRVR